MTFSLEDLFDIYGSGSGSFFTSDKKCIEYLLETNLQPLEEYALLVTQGEAYVMTPHEIADSRAKQIFYLGYSNKKYQDKISNILYILREFSLPPSVDTAWERQVYTDYFENRGCKINDITAKVKKDARCKTKKQIQAVEQSVRLCEGAYRALMGKSGEGETELSMFRHIRESITKYTAFPNQMICDFLAGERTGEVSGAPGNRRFCRRDTLIADLLPRHNGVYADMTRTFFLGEITEKQREIYGILCQALSEAEKKIMPGIMAKEIYESIQSVFRHYGLAEHFPHHGGHGLGMGYYEAPYFLEEETEILQENMVIAIEPGLYFENEFGIRIENNYVVTKEGVKCLGDLPLTQEDYILGFTGK